MTEAIRNVRPLGRPEAADLLIEDARIAAVLPAGTAAPELPTLVDGHGRLLLLPALVEAHTHFDKTLWGAPWRPNSAGPTREHRIHDEQAVFEDFPVPLQERAAPLVEQCIARGSLYFRSHVDVQAVFGLERIQQMLELRARFAHRVDMQLVAFPQGGLLSAPGTAELMEHALAMGLEVVGGIDPAGIDRDPVRHLEAVFELATRFGDRAIDIHLHDGGELGRFEIERIADMTEAHGLQGRVMISHAYALGAFAPEQLHPLADRLARLRISIMSCAPAHFMAPPLAMLRSRGVNVCSGSDNIRDTWSPMGNGDMLERARLIAMRFGWRTDEDLEAAFDIVSHGGAKALGIANYGLAPGCDANLLLLEARSLAEAVVSCPLDRTVISRGRVVARGGVFLDGAGVLS